MFRGLRLRLTLLYLFAALALIALVGTGTYRLVDSYLVNITDLGLQHKMAHEFRNRGITLPPELAHADQEWYSSRGTLAALPPTAVPEAAWRETADAFDAALADDLDTPGALVSLSEATRLVLHAEIGRAHV